MNHDEKHLLIVGLPETGKSSFIQALDEVLKHPPTSQSLRADRLAHDRSYIQDGKEKFLSGDPPDRTIRQIPDTSVELWFEHPATGRRFRLFLPDKRGEVFLDQWINRQWELQYRESLSQVAGALIFIRADQKPRNEERLGVLAAELMKSKVERPWEMKEASAQVQLVDVLQFIVDHSKVPLPVRSAVIISAWDTVGSKPSDLRPANPQKFLEKEWALLAQYLFSNPKLFTIKTYGVSAYGGSPGSLGPVLEKPPHERILLTDGTEPTNDLTLPLRWLLELD